MQCMHPALHRNASKSMTAVSYGYGYYEKLFATPFLHPIIKEFAPSPGPPTNGDNHEYESLDDPEGRILPQTLPPKPQIPLPPVPIDDMPWYWGNVSRY